MEEQGITKYETAHGTVSLSIAQVKNLFCPKATDAEAAMFLRLCQYQGLNPFLREAYLIKYDERSSATMVVGKDAFTQRAERQEQFDGFEAGVIIVGKEGDVERIEGSLVPPGKTLLGAWAKVYRKDRKLPFSETVSLDEYDRKVAQWKDRPATMIRKVALVHALREAFPSAFAGLYDQAELGEAVEAQGIQPPVSDKPATRAPSKPEQEPPAKDPTRARLNVLFKTLGWDTETLIAWTREKFKCLPGDMDEEERMEAVKLLEGELEAQQAQDGQGDEVEV